METSNQALSFGVITGKKPKSAFGTDSLSHIHTHSIAMEKKIFGIICRKNIAWKSL